MQATLTHFNVVQDTAPFLTGTRAHAIASLGQDSNHQTTITLVAVFALALYLLPRPSFETSQCAESLENGIISFSAFCTH